VIHRILGRRINLSRFYIGLERAARAFWPVWTLLFILYALSAAPDLKLSGRDPWALRLMAVVGVLAALIFARHPVL